MIAAVLCTFLALLTTPTLGQDSQVLAPPSPCPTVFTYDLPGPGPGWWSGAVNLSTDALLHSLWLDIVLDRQALKLLHSMVEVFTQDFKNFRIEDEDMQIQPGAPLSLRFSVKYDTNDEVPRVQTIRLNGIVICNALSAEEQVDSRLKTSINSKMKPVRPVSPSKQSLYPVYPRPDNSFGPGNISNAGDNFSGLREQCGTSTEVSQWPWVVAIYRTNNHRYDFFCGGALFSHRHVITSAKCVHVISPNPAANFVTNENHLVIHLGKQNFSSVLGVQIRLVQKLIVYPDYVETKAEYSGHDVALLILHEPVTYTDWVRPVCLWPANEQNLDSLIGKKGWLVGWGKDENDDGIEQLTAEEMPVVSEEMCLNSKGFSAYSFVQLNKYFCAGNREDTGLCKAGFLGNGMVFKMGNIWYLRGYISVFNTRILQKVELCDPTEYLKLTDLAKHVSWIHSVFTNYV